VHGQQQEGVVADLPVHDQDVKQQEEVTIPAAAVTEVETPEVALKPNKSTEEIQEEARRFFFEEFQPQMNEASCAAARANFAYSTNITKENEAVMVSLSI
jgi:hypothetical protein